MALRFTNVQTAPVGHNGPPKPARDAKRTAEEQAELEQVYRFAILQFVENRRLEETLGQGELASLASGPRFFTLMKGMLPNIVHLFRRSSRADTKLGVLVLIHFCADNGDGLCRLSVARFAQILSRDPRNVQRAIEDLEEGGEIGVHHSALGNSYWPKIARAVLDTSPCLGWFINAFSDGPAPFGRPRKPYGADAVSFSEEILSTKKDTAQSSKGCGADAVHKPLSNGSNKRIRVDDIGGEHLKRPQLQGCGVRT